MKIIILSERQLDQLSKKLLSEAVGVPQGIMDAGEKLYHIVLDELKKINNNEENYVIDILNQELVISDLTLNHINLSIHVEQIDDYEGKPVIASMGVSNEFKFDDGILMQINIPNKELMLTINFVVPEEWDPRDLYDTFASNEVHHISVMAHELKHRYDREKKPKSLVGDTAIYQAYSSTGLRFGIPVIENFMRYSYFIQMSENLVRPTEVATRMIKKGITKKQFYDFIVNDIAYKELKEIQNFSFDYLMKELIKQIDEVDGLIEHTGEDPDNMSVSEKIYFIFRLVYINLVNAKIDIFDNYFYSHQEKISQMFGGMFGKQFGGISKPNEEKEKIRHKFINHVSKYQNKETKFFVDECERFNYITTKLMKRIAKVYSLIPDEKEKTNESILNWDLHQQLMEKKYGKRKIETKIKDWKIK
jgi:hypothetical protein